ncbi:flagellin [Lentibacillus sp. CBA3610]|uniref:flagellin n=1 Tax=Lentibacillus sp. CBA3610 TaxID=2518176 RepID=UPI001595A903|nr:flagellin [Lentibacillus sp. CBA3610]QKY71271.1 hypothetical protein Len3610_18475 [Lentibacillus sp. CBA3610]
MRIGEMASHMMMMARNQENYTEKLYKANQQMATGKRVNSAADDPSMIGRIERTKAQLNESKWTQGALEDGINRNAMIEATLESARANGDELSSIAMRYQAEDADKPQMETQAKDLLNAMADTFTEASYNQTNPFDQDTSLFRISKNENDPSTYDIRKNDGAVLEGKTISDILDPEFIQENLTNEIAGSKSRVGTSTTILESKANYEKTKEEILTKSLSNMQDADLTEASTQATIAKQMIQINQNMMSSWHEQAGSVLDIRV